MPEALRTSRLLLRRWRREDRDPFAAMNADPDVMRFFPRPLTREESDAFVDRIEASFAERGYGLWAVEILDGGRFVGFVGLSDVNPVTPYGGALEVGWRLAAGAWGFGYATEAAAGSLDDALDRLGAEEVVSLTAVVNEPSQAVMRRLGMHRDPADDFDHPVVPEGHPVRPHVLYRISADEWRSRRAAGGVRGSAQ